MSTTRPRIHTHAEAWDMIPWLVTGNLPPGERAALDEHLRGCETCRCELDAQQQLRDVMRQQDNVDYAPGPSLQKLMWRLDEIAAEPPAAAGAQPAGKAPPARRRHATRWPGWLLGLQAAVIAILAVAVLFQAMERGTPLYRTVTEPRPAGADLRILFVPGTTARQIQLLLDASGTVIVGGPGPAGVYSLALAQGVPRSSASRAAETLRAQPEVLFVEVQPP
jgi:anti-sigma factor RsiW